LAILHFRLPSSASLTSVPDLQNTVSARDRLETQQQENRGVQKEFASLDDEANIYKLVGPVLLKQDKAEAVLAVDGRLEFIVGEMWVAFPYSTVMKYFMTEFGKAVVNSGKRRDGWKKGIEKGEGKARYLRTKADFQYRKRVEKQIAEMQDKSDKIRMQVIQAHSSNKSSMSWS